MGTVYVASARIDELGNAHGGQAGNQNGKELGKQAWYRHKDGWRVFRCKDAEKAARVAACMMAACANKNIGYDQWQRDTLYNAAKPLGFDCALVDKPVETDCSALVRVCLAYAGISTVNFRTYNEPKALLDTGQIVEMVGAQYTESAANLRVGDILCTPVSGHTVVVVEANGGTAPAPVKAGTPTSVTASVSGLDLLKKGSRGAQVKTLQRLLNAVVGTGLEVDGDFGAATRTAVRAYQTARGLDADGQCGPIMWTNLLKLEE